MFKRKFSIIVALVLLLGVSVLNRAQEEAASPVTGTINGQVVNERGEAMAGATVTVRPIGTFTPGRTTISDAEGNFRFTGLAPALYTVGAFSPAYLTQPPESGMPVPYYRIGDSVRVAMIKGGVITGTVTNATGEPIVGIRVRAVRVRDPKGKAIPVSMSGLERTTDDRGVYRIYGLGPGTYLVSAGGGSGNQSFQFYPFENDVPTYSPSSTRDNAAEFGVRGGEETTADIRYRYDSGHTVSGTVRVAANSGASVMLVSADGNYVPTSSAFQQPGTRGFAVNGVPDGDYYLFAQEIFNSMGGSAIPDFSASEGKRVTVKGADVGGIELITKPLSVISGVVALEPSKAPDCQGKRKPLFGEMLIEMQRHEKDTEIMAPFMRGVQSASPDQKGAFTVRNVMPARYRFSPRFYARYWYLQSISLGTPPATAAAKAAVSRTDPAATWTTIRSGEQLSHLTFTLTEGAASIRGKIAVAEGATIPTGMAVYLVPAEREKADNVLRYFVAQVVADGTFAFNNLPPGRYSPVTQNPAQSEIDSLVKLRLPESAEARLKLRRTAETQKSDIELKPCQNLTDFQLSIK